MKATELMDELHLIIQDMGDVEITEYWLRIILDLSIQKYIDKRTGKPMLHAVGDDDVNS